MTHYDGRGLASRIRRAREARGWTQAELAELVGIATEAYGRIERGSAMPRADTLASIAAALGVSADQLLGLIQPKGLKLADSGAADLPESPEARRILKRLRRMPGPALAALDQLLEALAEPRPPRR